MTLEAYRLLVYWIFVIFAKNETNGVFVLQIMSSDGQNFDDAICNQEITHPVPRGIIDIRMPSHLEDPQVCFCLLYHGYWEDWPNEEYVVVDYDNTTANMRTFWLNLTVADVYYGKAILFMLYTENTYHKIQIHAARMDFRYLLENRVVRFESKNVELNLRCNHSSFPHIQQGESSSVPATTTPIIPRATSATTNTEQQTKTPTNATSNGNGKSNNSYIIIGATIAGVLFIVIIVVIIGICMKKKGYIYCCCLQKTTKTTKPDIYAESNNDRLTKTVKDTPNLQEEAEYVNVTTELGANEPIEYAEVDISRLAPRQQSDKQNLQAKDTNETTITYADLALVQREVKNDEENGTEVDNQDISEMYAKPMKKPKPPKGNFNNTTMDIRQKNISEMYAKPIKKPKAIKETSIPDPQTTNDCANGSLVEDARDILEMYATPVKKPKSNKTDQTNEI